MDAPETNPALLILMIVWAVVTAGLVILLIYRGALSNREEDQIFLDAAQEGIAKEQRLLVARIGRLSRPINLLVISSGALLVVIAAMWLWDAFKRF